MVSDFGIVSSAGIIFSIGIVPGIGVRHCPHPITAELWIVNPPRPQPKPEAQSHQSGGAGGGDAVETEVGQKGDDIASAEHGDDGQNGLSQADGGEIPFKEADQGQGPEQHGRGKKEEGGGDGVEPESARMHARGEELEGEEKQEGGDDPEIGIPVPLIEDVVPVDGRALGKQVVAGGHRMRACRFGQKGVQGWPFKIAWADS